MTETATSVPVGERAQWPQPEWMCSLCKGRGRFARRSQLKCERCQSHFLFDHVTLKHRLASYTRNRWLHDVGDLLLREPPERWERLIREMPQMFFLKRLTEPARCCIEHDCTWYHKGDIEPKLLVEVEIDDLVFHVSHGKHTPHFHSVTGEY